MSNRMIGETSTVILAAISLLVAIYVSDLCPPDWPVCVGIVVLLVTAGACMFSLVFLFRLLSALLW